MKIVYAFMNSYAAGKSGGDVAFIEIFKRIKNIKLIVITSALGKKLCRESNLSADYQLTTQEKYFNNTWFIYLQRIVKGLFLKTLPKDIIYATSDAMPDVLPAFFLKKKYPKMEWVQKIYHLIPEDRFFSHWSQRISFFLIKNLADIIIVDNKILKKHLIQIGFCEKRLFVNSLGTDFSYFRKIKPSKISYEGVFMARLHPSKGIFDLVEIWKGVVAKFPKAKLAIIGRGEKKVMNLLSKKIHKAKLEKNIVILGYLKDDQAFSLIKSAKLFVLPSYEEGFGLVILESLACGTPVVAYDLTGYHPDIKKQICLVPKNDTIMFVKTIKAKIKNGKRVVLEKDFLHKFDWRQTAQNEKKLVILI